MDLGSRIQPPYERCTDVALSAEFVDPPARFIEPNSESRLIPALRDAAWTHDPYKILALAAAAFHAQDTELGNAFADLSVTGGMAYSLFKTPPLTPLDELRLDATMNYIDLGHAPHDQAALRAVIGGHLSALVQTTAAEATKAIDSALDRAYSVAWALRGPRSQQAAARPAGWIAVSGEDDKPHRPVNVPPPPFDQCEIPVTMGGITVQTRFFIASPPAGPAPATPPRPLRTLPPDMIPHIPEGNQVILFLHGHSSGAEEALTIIPHIHMAGLRQSQKFSIISFDLPNNGYSESFDHEKVATTTATTWPAGPADTGKILTPVLDYIENFIVAFVDALDAVVPIKNRFSGVIGGSLGGNMGLRLGRRDLTASPWLGAGIVSWNAASVWDPMVNDLIKSQAPGRCQNSWNASESTTSRADYLKEVFDKTVHPIFIPHTQPELWYRTNWEPCKRLHIQGARLARREIYNANFRQWHWRVAGEQLVFSHVDRVDHSDPTSPWRYTLNTVRHLLVASQNDNFTGSNIFDATRTLASLMTTTPGQSMLFGTTGHSVHFERPAYFAKQIATFLAGPPLGLNTPTMVMSMQITCIFREQILSTGKRKKSGPPRFGRILLVGGINHTKNESFSLTTEEAIRYIDYGCELFVVRSDGKRTPVGVVRKGGVREYIATVHDVTEANNLLSLPMC